MFGRIKAFQNIGSPHCMKNSIVRTIKRCFILTYFQILFLRPQAFHWLFPSDSRPVPLSCLPKNNPLLLHILIKRKYTSPFFKIFFLNIHYGKNSVIAKVHIRWPYDKFFPCPVIHILFNHNGNVHITFWCIVFSCYRAILPGFIISFIFILYNRFYFINISLYNSVPNSIC